MPFSTFLEDVFSYAIFAVRSLIIVIKAGSQYDAGTASVTKRCERHGRKHFFTSQILFLKSIFLTF